MSNRKRMGGKMIGTTAAINAVMRRVAAEFPSIPEGAVMAAVVTRAIQDLAVSGDSSEAVYLRARGAAYLRGEMWHALIAGVEPDYVRRVLRGAGLDITEGGQYDEAGAYLGPKAAQRAEGANHAD